MPGESAKYRDGWDESDSLDIEMLEAFLLDDDHGAADITLDPNVDSAKSDSTMVSPEGSDDGSLPGVTMAPAKVTFPPTLPMLLPKLPSLGAYGEAVLRYTQLATKAENNGMRSLAALRNGCCRNRRRTYLDRHREKNRILARRSRLKKKSLFEELKEDIAFLYRENQMLKALVKMYIGGIESVRILSEYDADSKLPEDVLKVCNVKVTNEYQQVDMVTEILRARSQCTLAA